MLRTNSKQARENIKKYIIDNFTPENYTETPPTEWHEIARFILETFRAEKYSILQDFKYYKGNEYLAFADWCAGLPSLLDTCYYYNRSAVDDLGEILEQNATERARFNESKAEQTLTILIYNELLRGEKQCLKHTI